MYVRAGRLKSLAVLGWITITHIECTCHNRLYTGCPTNTSVTNWFSAATRVFTREGDGQQLVHTVYSLTLPCETQHSRRTTGISLRPGIIVDMSVRSVVTDADENGKRNDEAYPTCPTLFS